MQRKPRKRTKKVGLPPGSLIYTGNGDKEAVKITIIDYDENNFKEHKIIDCTECFPYKNSPTVTWINVDGIHELDIIETMGKYFNIHPLVLEDLMNINQRPKMENYKNYAFIVIRMLKYNESEDKIDDEQLSLIIGDNFIISFQEKEGDVFDPIRMRIRESRGFIRKMKSDYLAYALIDTIVDNYFIIIEKLEERAEKIEETLSNQTTPQSLQEINILKREIISMRKAIWPLREFLNIIEKGELSLFAENTVLYLRDVHDHVVQLIDILDNLREMISDMTNLYISTISNRLNEIMKVLTIISTIFIPLTFLAGIYGMNFEYMPELKTRFGYPIALFVMFIIGVLMIFYFRRKKWL